MELITILLILVSVLTLFSGVTMLVGAERGVKPKAAVFFLTTLFAVLWAFSVIIFLNMQPGKDELARVMIFLIYTTPILMMLMQVFYSGWGKKICFKLGILYILATIVFIVVFIADRHTFYENFALDPSAGNSVTFAGGWLYVYYIILTLAMLATFVLAAVYNAKKEDSKRLRIGNAVFATGLFITGAIAVIFNLILPIFGVYSLVYVGPLTLSVAAILHFYAILRYRLIVLSNTWLKIGSYVILMSVAAVAYMVIFSLIFSLLFKIERVSTEIMIMNFIMIMIVLLILPVFNEVNGFIRSLISVQEINLQYVIRKLNRLATQNVDLNELATFLADNLHFKYIGLVVDGKIYGSEKIEFSKEAIRELSMLETEGHSIWQKVEGHTKQLFLEDNIVAVAELRNAKGRPFGQILVGQPLGKVSFEKRDLTQIELILNLVASIIDSEKRLKA